MRSLTLLPYTENHFLHPRPCDRSFSTFLRSKVNASHPKNLAEGGMTAQKSQGDHRRSKDQRRGFPDDCTVKSAWSRKLSSQILFLLNMTCHDRSWYLMMLLLWFKFQPFGDGHTWDCPNSATVMNTRQDSLLCRGSTTFQSINLDLTFPLLVGRQLPGYIEINTQTPNGWGLQQKPCV